MTTSLMLVGTDSRNDYEETRKIGFGFIGRRLIVVACTERNPDVIRIISTREANRREKSRYQKRSRTNWTKIDPLKNSKIDTSDISEQGKALIKRAVLRLPKPRTAVTIRLGRQSLEWFNNKGTWTSDKKYRPTPRVHGSAQILRANSCAKTRKQNMSNKVVRAMADRRRQDHSSDPAGTT